MAAAQSSSGAEAAEVSPCSAIAAAQSSSLILFSSLSAMAVSGLGGFVCEDVGEVILHDKMVDLDGVIAVEGAETRPQYRYVVRFDDEQFGRLKRNHVADTQVDDVAQ